MRKTYCCLSLGQNKIRFIPELVGPFLEMTLLPEIGEYLLEYHYGTYIVSVPAA